MPKATHGRSHKKRHGQHQKRNNHFLKVYLPYVPLTVFLVTGLLLSFWKPSANKGVLSYAIEISSGALLNGTNQNRAQNGAGSLALNGQLSAAAQAKANDMAARNYWSHNTPEGNPPWVFISNAGYSYSRAGENLAYGFATSSETITGWMNSPSHRDNMLNKDYTEVGFGYTNASNYNNSGEQTIIVAMYGTPLAASAPPPAAAKPQAKTTPKQTTVVATPEVPKPTRDVEVTVLDENNKPVAGVKVTLHSTPREAVTDNDGVALFKDVEEGEHTATAEIDGAKREQTLTVTSDTQKVSVSLPAPKLTANTTSSTATAVQPKKVSRLEVITKGALPWLAGTMSAAALLGGAYLLGKHSRSLHRLVVRGERYVLQHSILDVTILSFLWLCFVVSRTAGVIL